MNTTKYHLLAFFVSFSLVEITGCSSVMTHTGHPQRYYSGTRGSAAILTDSESSWMLKSLATIDLHFSAIMDTLLLPWDYMRTSDDVTLNSHRERLLRIKQRPSSTESQKYQTPVVANSVQP